MDHYKHIKKFQVSINTKQSDLLSKTFINIINHK